MALDAAVGRVSIAEDRIATMLSNCAAFISFTGEALPAAALARIHFDAIDEPAGATFTVADRNSLYPYALIWTETIRLEQAAYASSPQAVASGTVRVMFCKFDDKDLTQEENARRHKNLWGQILDELFTENVPGDTAEIRTIRTLSPEETSDLDQRPMLGLQSTDLGEDHIFADLFCRAIEIEWSTGSP